MAMGVRATLVGGKGLEANRRCGRSTAGAVGAVAGGTKYSTKRTQSSKRTHSQTSVQLKHQSDQVGRTSSNTVTAGCDGKCVR
eukprot:SAG11_NODE_832_length_6948_cov_10.083662_2_plen_83_part_00